ncbi:MULTISPECIES: DUF1304 domain-containing protein [unclassified Arthrobacter]|uniref:DUF1304 domain-containing protein n=1 Tax=unclassified Arthrobacter TaxID=235627 RepID=UPI0014928B03|nr:MULTISPECIES: DUF1304 domain-containing protein [unclassified Arthrobacter]MBE0011441.1 DUF1304 domain-containing protein [Arthrobacter sp. AET 35A]NOJ59475.1 DUF1304 domain-containing protein [Arthrobacter sp. 260]
MTGIVWTFALIAALTHIVVFLWEAVLFERPGVHHRIFLTATADVPAVRLWAFGVGFYNLFLAAGILVGVALWATGNETVGGTLVIYVCWFMFLSGVVLFIADRMALGRPKGTGLGGALGQGLPPLIALIGAAL